MSDNNSDLPNNVIPLFKPKDDVVALRPMTPEEGERIVNIFAELEALEEEDDSSSKH